MWAGKWENLNLSEFNFLEKGGRAKNKLESGWEHIQRIGEK
jgi:hypothetical protein